MVYPRPVDVNNQCERICGFDWRGTFYAGVSGEMRLRVKVCDKSVTSFVIKK